jgi:hypothetical protein
VHFGGCQPAQEVFVSVVIDRQSEFGKRGGVSGRWVERTEIHADFHKLKTQGIALCAPAHLRLLWMVGVPMAKIFGGRWRFIKSVGEGGQSWVYIVEDRTGLHDFGMKSRFCDGSTTITSSSSLTLRFGKMGAMTRAIW